MKIVIFHQPFPMGNYNLNHYIGNILQSNGHEVYLIEQLNGAEYTDEYVQQFIDLNPDVLYFEMLDEKTFEVVEKINCKKVLVMASKGILNKTEDIVDYYGKWYDGLLVNSKYIYDLVKKKTDLVEHFQYYLTPISDEESVYDSKYNYDCVFLGQGFHRLSQVEFQKERDAFFSQSYPFNYKVFGNGWPQISWYGGILPHGDIGKLYTSAKSGVSLIEVDQRPYGMINNRYSEMGSCGCPIITFDYDEIDWFGADKYMNIVDNYSDVVEVVNKCLNDDEDVINKSVELKKFMNNQHKTFMEKIDRLINEN
jgi:hypothetical protein